MHIKILTISILGLLISGCGGGSGGGGGAGALKSPPMGNSFRSHPCGLFKKSPAPGRNRRALDTAVALIKGNLSYNFAFVNNLLVLFS